MAYKFQTKSNFEPYYLSLAVVYLHCLLDCYSLLYCLLCTEETVIQAQGKIECTATKYI